ncbi:murein hydrolase activator EnvC [Brucella sp. 10RB9213]|uniref:murein hydrolase activator EnvC family protein n=1 Tax=Brucella sp. 10RB9213 TaxID=1844039 RepID=UPI0012AD674D|nr:murein hydrolase activator EnvC [Brucella sp. 10RB9213]MRN67093.1 peptidoglycan DD-metalloendopeptidase family protein [Brucella sp. 10RB9213]
MNSIGLFRTLGGFAPLRAGRLLAGFALAGALACAPPAVAQDALMQQRDQMASEYEKLTNELTVTGDTLKQLEDEVASLKKDQSTITAALIQSAKTDKKLQQDIADIADRLVALREQEDGIRASLRARRGVLAEVLAALQRMGLNPPPAILVRPDDALASVRSAVLLGAVVPDMRDQVKELAGDLKDMQHVSASIAQEQEKLKETRTAQAEERERQSLLLEEKKKLQRQSEQEIEAQRKHSEELAAKAGSLKELIASLDKQMASVREAAEAARKAEAERLAAAKEKAGESTPGDRHLRAQSDFSTLQGRLVLPAAGKIMRRFGDKDGVGGSMMGQVVETLPSATITSPSDGVVLYAGVFRSYGQLLILDAGNGYHIVMAGMGRIDVAQGQFVLAGEPVGAMGEKLLASVAPVEVGNGAPLLYIEFRKDGKPVDPAPWWTERLSGRTQNDT